MALCLANANSNNHINPVNPVTSISNASLASDEAASLLMKEAEFSLLGVDPDGSIPGASASSPSVLSENENSNHGSIIHDSNDIVDNQQNQEVSMKIENLEGWDQDVLLSNAGLPETNPLLLDEELDQNVGEDFQKMLNEWEHHIGSLQVRQIFYISIAQCTLHSGQIG